MKNLLLKILFLIIPFVATLGQQTVSYRKLVDDQYVPKEVRTSFKTQYPRVMLSIWYSSHITYWYEDYAQAWYGDWYPTRQVVVYKLEKPAYYEVDFQYNGNPSRAIYNRYGQWFETRSRIQVLPDIVSAGLRETEFGDWVWSEHKEQIFIPAYNGDIFRLRVYNRKESYIVRLNGFGEIVQIKYQ